MNRKKLTVVSLVTIPLMVGGGVVVAESAFAGTNGQQIQLCQPSSDYQSADIRGLNQNGVIAQLHVDGLKRECKTAEGYLWQGKVHINWSNPAGQGSPLTWGKDCDVPKNWAGGNSWPCYGPNA
jgi:hypothetical protein